MLARRIYYILKPYLPRGVRIAMRRIVAKKVRAKSTAIWPINESTSKPPQGWPGWPDGKKFAVVLTHDVEGPEGVASCRDLAELEKSLGYRSSFNFIPEGTYRVDPQLRAWLTAQGFEVGIHDLNHDGHLYSSHSGFLNKAQRINNYIKDWNASGFRAGFMLRNLDWVHNLDIKYDASTFDTDPFEPQPDGAGTIFPFWIPTPAKQPGDNNGNSIETSSAPITPNQHGGYCELPYTLAQDSTLFLVLQETTNEIWRSKLDWVASHGGMVLINVHPDYLSVQGNRRKSAKTVRDHYADLLQYLTATYGSTYWHALPREMASFVHAHKNSAIASNQSKQ